VTKAQTLLKQVGGKGMAQGVDRDFFLMPHSPTTAFMADWALPAPIGPLAARICAGVPVGLGNSRRGCWCLHHRARKPPIGKIRQGNKAILMSLAPTDMNFPSVTIDITDFQRQRFTEAQTHGIGGKKEYPEPKMASGTNQLLDLGHGQDIGQGFDFWGSDDIDPGPVLLEHMLPEELKTIAIDFNRAPGMRIDQFGKVDLKLLRGELIRATLVIRSDPPHSTGIGIDSALAETAQFESS
jgi:hypothetical protein